MSEQKTKPKPKAKRVPGVKYMITGFTGSGKTYITKELRDAFVINGDHTKAYTQPHTYTTIYPTGFFKDATERGDDIEWAGVDKFKMEIIGKLKRYKELTGKVPKIVVLDTITALFGKMIAYNEKTVKNVYGSLGVKCAADVDKMNNLIEKLFVSKGVHVILLAHSVYDEASEKWTIPTKGSKTFSDQGGWMSYVDYASWLHDDGDATRMISHKVVGAPCKSKLEGIEESQPVDSFDINDMLDAIIEKSKEQVGLRI